MAKKRQQRSPKQVSPLRTAAEIRELAAGLRRLAEQIDQCADVMQRQRIAEIRPLTGNFQNALETIRRFVNRQMLPRIADAAHELFRPAVKSNRRGRR